jgi:hypothetical protein
MASIPFDTSHHTIFSVAARLLGPKPVQPFAPEKLLGRLGCDARETCVYGLDLNVAAP